MCHPGDIFRHHQNPDLPRRVGLRTTAKERPWLHRGIPPLAPASCSTASEDPARYDPQANSLGIRPTNVHGRAERIPPQSRPLACLGIVPARQNRFGLAPLGGSGSARPPRKASARPCHVPCWPPAVAQPHPRTLPGRIRKRTGSACDQHIFTDARSASLRKRYSRQHTFRVLFPQGHTLGVGPSEGRALHDRQGTPCPTVAFPPLATAFGRTAWVGMLFTTAQMGLGIRPTHLHGRVERIPPQTRPLACLGIVPARQNGFGLAPLGGSGSARPPRKALARPWHSVSGNRLLLNRIRGPRPERFASEWPRHSTNKCSRTRGAHPSANLASGLSRNCPR